MQVLELGLISMALWDGTWLTRLSRTAVSPCCFEECLLLFSHGAEDAQLHLFSRGREVLGDRPSPDSPPQVAPVCPTGNSLHPGWPEPTSLLLWCTGAGMHHELDSPGLCSSLSVWIT